MENENENIIDSQENNEAEEIILEENETETEETVEEEKPEQEKPQETLEAKRARLKRQLGQVEKKLGLAEEKPKEVTNQPQLSSKDLLALMKAEVSDEDVDEVVDYARFKKISVAEALKSSVIKQTLAEKSEQRKIANATFTGTSKRATTKVSDETLLSNAKKGIMPDSEEDIERLFEIRHNLKK